MKQFNSIDEITEDQIFILKVNKVIQDLRSERLKRPDPKPGYRYKRDWYDRMTDARQLNQQFIIDNMKLILTKKSDLPSEIRDIIKYIIDKSLQLTISWYRELEAKSIPKPQTVKDIKPKRRYTKKATI